MKIQAKIDYACRALVELGLHWPNVTPLQVAQIARRQKIPVGFLVHILITLKQLGYVDSVRGKSGGYVLIKSPQHIRLSDVIKNFGGLGLSPEKKSRSVRHLHVMDAVWQDLDDAFLKAIDSVTLESICNRERGRGGVLTYEI